MKQDHNISPGSCGKSQASVALSLPVRTISVNGSPINSRPSRIELATLCKRKVEVPSDSVLALAVVARASELVAMLSVLTDLSSTDMTAEEIDGDLAQWGEPDEFHALPLHEIDAHYAAQLSGGGANV